MRTWLRFWRMPSTYFVRQISAAAPRDGGGGVKPKKKLAPLQERKMVDKFRLHVHGGQGGAGCTSFRKGRLSRHGFADGGNGGRGGDVILVGSAALWDLSNLQHHLNGKCGGQGSSKKRIGSRGVDKIVQVPVGTVIHLVKGTLPSLEGSSVLQHVSTSEEWGAAPSPSPFPALDRGAGREGPRVDPVGGFAKEVNRVQDFRSGAGLDCVLDESEASPDTSNPRVSDHFEIPRCNSAKDLPRAVLYEDEGGVSEDSAWSDGTGYDYDHNHDEEEEEDENRNSQQEFRESVAEFTSPGQSIIVAQGGNGGKGNAAMARGRGSGKSLPSLDHELGQSGTEADLILELKAIADVGLVGVPNAGKSTLLGSLSRAKPVCGHYKFTTLRPNIGMVEFDDFYSLTVADIPGLLQGAHQNRGLGHAFLRHIERTKVLAYVVDLAGGIGFDTGPRPWDQYAELVFELEQYQTGLSRRPSVIVANKIDENGASSALETLRERVPFLEIYPVCAVLDEGVEALKIGIRKLVEAVPVVDSPALSRPREV